MLNSLHIPNHLAIIMDGNSRWAAKKGLSKSQGHKQGAEAARRFLEIALSYNIKNLTLYAFSSENWKRPEDEVSNMMDLMKYYLDAEIPNLQQNNIRLIVIGNLSKLDKEFRNQIQKAEVDTANNTKMNLYIAASYGGKQEIIDMVKNIVSKQYKPEDINENLIKNCLYSSDMPDVDLLIRTGGDKRISNFLPWHIAYSELLFIDKYWPDFDERDFLSAISDFNRRKRNFGQSREKN